jgi:hypothetical protein
LVILSSMMLKMDNFPNRYINIKITSLTYCKAQQDEANCFLTFSTSTQYSTFLRFCVSIVAFLSLR